MGTRTLAPLLLAATVVLAVESRAIELVAPITHSPGADAVVGPAGTYGAIQIGWNPEPAGNVGTPNGEITGNAVVLTDVTDQVVQEADIFNISWTSGGYAEVDVTSAENVASYCGLVDAHPSLTCRVRPEGVQITSPFLSTITEFHFTHAPVAGRESNITVSGITDASAAAVNRFEVALSGVLYAAPAGTFDGVTTVAQLAAAIDALSFVKTGTVTADSIQVLANDIGPSGFEAFRLEHFVAAVSPQVTFTGVSTETAALVDRVRIERDGVAQSMAGVDLSTVTDLASLAAQLSASPDLDAAVSGSDLIVILVPAGSGAVTRASLHALPRLTGTEGAVAYDENDTVTLDSSVSVSHPAGAVLAQATVAIGANFVDSEDVLAVSAPGALLVAYSGGVLTLTGPGTVEEFESALRSVTYTNSSEAPSQAPRALQLTVADADDVSAPLGYTLAPTSINDLPRMTVAASLLLYGENQGPVVVDDSVSILDLDGDDITTARVVILGGFAAGEDTLSVTAPPELEVSWNAEWGILDLTGRLTAAEYETVLRSVTFSNSSEAPTGTFRDITFAVSDFRGVGPVSHRLLQLVPSDDAAVITLASSALEYEENSAVAVDDSLSITDLDDAQAAGARVTLSAGFVPSEDVLELPAVGAITGSYDPAEGVLTLQGSASLGDYRDALRSVRYRNSSDRPSSTDRGISFALALGSGYGVAVERTVHIVPINDAPVIAAGAGSGGTSDGLAATTLASNLQLADVDDDVLTGATVRITAGSSEGDLLQLGSAAGLTASFDPAVMRLTLSGTASLADYRTALASVAYLNGSEEPAPGVRTFALEVTDGKTSSNVATLQVTVERPEPEVPSSCGCGAMPGTGFSLFGALLALRSLTLLRRRR